MTNRHDQSLGTHERREEADFRAEVTAFLAEHAQPKREVSLWALDLDFDADAARATFERGRAWQAKLFEHRLAGLTYPERYGGRGGRAWHERIFNEEVRGYDIGRPFVTATIAMLAPTLMRHGTEAQRAHFLPRLLSAEYAFCQLFSEPTAGSDLAGLACRAERDGDRFVVTGQKVWNSAAQFCDWGMLLVRTSPDLPKHQGITFLLVDMTTPGIEVRPLVQATGASEFNEVFLDDVEVPVDNVLGDIDGGWAPARTVMSAESNFIGGGGGGGAFSRVLQLAQRHGQTGDRTVRQDLADLYARERLLRVTGGRLQASFASGRSPIDPALLKLFATDYRVKIGQIASGIAGPAAVAGDDEIAAWVQFQVMVRYAFSIGGGTDEVQRNNLAERALGLPKELRADKSAAWKDVPRN